MSRVKRLIEFLLTGAMVLLLAPIAYAHRHEL